MAEMETKLEVLTNKTEGHIDDVMIKIDRMLQRALDIADRMQSAGEVGSKVDLTVSNLGAKLEVF